MNNKVKSTNLIENISYIIFGSLSIVWIYAYFFTEVSSSWYTVFTNTYGIMALFGGVIGIIAAKKWGGFDSLFGKAIMLFSIGLLFQELGQVLYMYYIYIQGIEIPYPSLGDIGFFGSVLFYIYGSICLMKATGTAWSIKGKTFGKFFAFAIPLAMLLISYYFLINGTEVDKDHIVTTALDFGYPLFQAVYVSIALITYALSQESMKGGKIKNHIAFILIALFVQYIADFTFLYRSKHDIWVPGGPSDYVYLVAYFLMALAIIKLSKFFDNLKNT